MAPEKTERVHLVMSADELRALDDWRFANKIASRSEAVRVLIAEGVKRKAPKPRAK